MFQHPIVFRLQSWLLIPALALAFLAQYFFTGEWFTRLRDSNGWDWPPQYTLASICLLAAIVCASWAAATRRHEALPSVMPLRLAARAHLILLASLGCYLLSLERYLVDGEGVLVQGLWVVGCLILVGGLWYTMRPSGHDRWVRSEYLMVGVISIIGFVLRFWQLGTLPAHIDNDVSWVGAVARDMIANQDYRWIGYSNESVHLQSYTQFYAWSMRIFGEDLFGLVITSAVAGTLTIPVVYALGRELYGQRTGMIAMALMACNYTHIHFSRTMFSPKATLFATLTWFLVFRGLRQREPFWFALGGLSAGMGLLFYDSSRVIPIVALALFAWCLITQRAVLRANTWGIILFVIGFLLGFGPMLAFAVTQFDAFLGRGHEVMIWSPEVWAHQKSAYGVSSIPEIILMQATRTFLTFHLYGDSSPQFSFPRPMVDALTGALLVVGLGVLLLRLRDIRALCLLMWIGLTLVLGGVLTYDPPFWPHLTVALPAVILIAAVGADRLLALWPEQRGPWAGVLFQWVLIIAIGLTAIQNWYIYATFASNDSGPRNRISDVISELPPGYHVILVSDEYNPDNYAFRFFNHDVPIEQRNETTLRTDPLPSQTPLLFILHHADHLLPWLEARYPTADVQQHSDRDGNVLFLTLQVKPPGWKTPDAQAPEPNPDHWMLAFFLGLLVGWLGHTLWRVGNIGEMRRAPQSTTLMVPQPESSRKGTRRECS